MIMPLLAFVYAFVLFLSNYNVISEHSKFILTIVTISLTPISLVIQFVILLGELAWAREYWMKLLLHVMVINILGSYGPASALVFREFREKQFGDYGKAKGRLWRPILYVGHGLAKVLGALTFGDAFSGKFAVKHTSVAFWLGETSEECDGWQRPKIDETEDLWSTPRAKEVRDLILRIDFVPIEQEQSETGTASTPTEDKQPLVDIKVEQQATNGGESNPADQQELIGTVSSPSGQEQRTGAYVVSEIERTETDQATTEAVSSPAKQEQPKTLTCHVSASGSRDGPLANLYRKDWNDIKCSKASALEFCTLMEALNIDSFVVTERPKEGSDHILSCEKLEKLDQVGKVGQVGLCKAFS